MTNDNNINAAIERTIERLEIKVTEEACIAHHVDDIALVCREARLAQRYRKALARIKEGVVFPTKIAEEALKDDN